MKANPVKNIWVWVIVGLYALSMLLSLQLLPIDDDWFFLKYFPQSSSWGVESYPWLWGNRLLPRDYWRPLEDILLGFQTHHTSTYPYLNHIFVVSVYYASMLLLYPLGRRLRISAKYLWPSIAIGCILANNMGALFSIDSLTHVLATFFGLLSVLALSRIRSGWRWVAWIMAGFMACVSKESGCVYFVIGPLYLLLGRNCENKTITFWALLKKSPRYVITGIVPALIYAGGYYWLKKQQPVEQESPAAEMVVYKNSSNGANLHVAGLKGDGFMEQMEVSQKTHRLSASVIAKNIFILYGAGIFPADTSAVYYHNYGLLALTAFLGLGGPILAIRMLRRRGNYPSGVLWGVAVLGVIASLPSLATRAGEISPFISNVWFVLLLAGLLEGYKWRQGDTLLTFAFICATIITDGHKFSLGHEGGVAARQMATEAASQMGSRPGKVLWIGPDESGLDRAGAAFSRSPYMAFRQGEALTMQYDYKQPLKLHRIFLPENASDAEIAEEVAANISHYNYIVITRGRNVRVVKGTLKGTL